MARHSTKVSRYQAETPQQFVDKPTWNVAIRSQDLAGKQQRYRRGTAVTPGQFGVVFRARFLDICSRQHPFFVVITASPSPSATDVPSASFAGFDAILSGPSSVRWPTAKSSPSSSPWASAQLLPVSGQSHISGRPSDGAGDSTALR